MPVDMKKIKAARERAAAKQGKVDYMKFTEGEHLLYICPPLEDYDLFFAESGIHYKVGPKKQIVTCLEPENNASLKDPRVIEILRKKGIDISDGCKVCQLLDEGTQVGDAAKDRYLFPVIPLKYRKNSTKKWREHDDANELKMVGCGLQIWDGVMDVFVNNGDITDPSSAILVRLVKEGSGLATKYSVSADVESVSNHGISLSKPVKALIRRAMVEGGSGDAWKVAAGNVKSSAEVEAIVTGVPLEDAKGSDDEAPAEGKKPDCFTLDYEEGDQDCKDCEFSEDCKEACEVPGGEASETEPEPESPKRPKRPGKPKKASEPEPEPDDPDDEDEGYTVGDEVKVKDCVEGELYTEFDDEIIALEFTGTSKKGRKVWGFFKTPAGETRRMGGSAVVYELNSSDEDEEEDEDLKALDRAIANRKKKS